RRHPRCGARRQRLAGVGPVTHRRGGHRHRLPRTRRPLRDDRRPGAARDRSHPRSRRNGAAARLGRGWAAGRGDALAGAGHPDGRPPDRPARIDRAQWSRRNRRGGATPMNDTMGLLLACLLIAVNAFFVGAEFALISARRDRLEALAEQGKAAAVTVIRAGEQLPSMLAGAQLGVTAASLLLGRIGEAAVADLLQTALGLTAIHPALLHTLSFAIALAIVVTLHVLLGEMVPKNIALAGPERTAMLLVPPYLAYVRAARPFIVFYDKCASLVVRALGVERKEELEMTVSPVELSEMIAESA